MLGNDVVDLRDPETHTRHAGFDARVFSAGERRVIDDAADPHAMRQLLWAAKESAYKAARRMDPRVVFSPVRFQVELHAMDATDSMAPMDSAGRGVVHHDSGLARLRVTRSGDCVHAVACLSGDPAASRSAVAQIGTRDPGSAARALALDALSASLGVPRGDLEIARHRRIPELSLRGLPARVPLTLSHHGRFAAYAALPPVSDHARAAGRNEH